MMNGAGGGKRKTMEDEDLEILSISGPRSWAAAGAGHTPKTKTTPSPRQQQQQGRKRLRVENMDPNFVPIRGTEEEAFQQFYDEREGSCFSVSDLLLHQPPPPPPPPALPLPPGPAKVMVGGAMPVRLPPLPPSTTTTAPPQFPRKPRISTPTPRPGPRSLVRPTPAPATATATATATASLKPPPPPPPPPLALVPVITSVSSLSSAPSPSPTPTGEKKEEKKKYKPLFPSVRPCGPVSYSHHVTVRKVGGPGGTQQRRVVLRPLSFTRKSANPTLKKKGVDPPLITIPDSPSSEEEEEVDDASWVGNITNTFSMSQPEGDAAPPPPPPAIPKLTPPPEKVEETEQEVGVPVPPEGTEPVGEEELGVSVSVPSPKDGLCDSCGCLILPSGGGEGETLSDHICGETLCPGCGLLCENRDALRRHEEEGGCDAAPPAAAPPLLEKEEETGLTTKEEPTPTTPTPAAQPRKSERLQKPVFVPETETEWVTNFSSDEDDEEEDDQNCETSEECCSSFSESESEGEEEEVQKGDRELMPPPPPPPSFNGPSTSAQLQRELQLQKEQREAKAALPKKPKRPRLSIRKPSPLKNKDPRFLKITQNGLKFRIKLTVRPLVHECSICGVKFEGEEWLLWDHVLDAHLSVSTYDCDRCSDVSFSRPLDLFRHTTTAHPPDSNHPRVRETTGPYW